VSLRTRLTGSGGIAASSVQVDAPSLLDRLPTQSRGRAARFLWVVAILALAGGLLTWALGAGIVALWSFTGAAVALALVLPMPYAMVSPLFMGVVGWLVDMLPFLVLAGWATVMCRWALGLLGERRLPRGGAWIWLPIGLAFWTALGVIAISGEDIKHYLLLLGIQLVASGAILAVGDTLDSLEERARLVTGLVVFVLVLSAGVILEYVGVPIQSMQDGRTSRLVESAYGVDAFPNNVGMVKYERSRIGGAGQLLREIEKLRRSEPSMPPVEVFQPRLGTFPGKLIVRFHGSARAYQEQLAGLGVDLAYDNLGFGVSNTVPRMRSFPRNANTYAGICVAVLPFAFFLAWTSTGRRRVLGWAGVAAALFGIGFSLTRGAWLAGLLGLACVVVLGAVSRRHKAEAVVAFGAAAVFLTGFFLIKYDVDPLFARAKGEGSINTRQNLYRDTLESVNGINLVVGYGTEKPRTSSGVSHALGQYIPRSGTHSTYLNYFFRTGAPGALMIIALYGWAALHALLTSRRTTGSEATFFSVGAAAAVIAAAHGVVLSLYVEPIYTLTIALVLGLALTRPPGGREWTASWRGRSVRR
jgi:ABC-type multidrug transport system fused ATPase/permease subunit